MSNRVVSPTYEELENAILSRTNNPSFAEIRARQLLAAQNGDPGYAEVERRIAQPLIDHYMGQDRRRALR